MLQALHAQDPGADTRDKLQAIAAARDEWAGIPMPIEGEQLVIEPRYPYAALAELGQPEPAPDAEPVKFRNTLWSHRHRCYVHIVEHAGRIRAIPQPSKAIDLALHTMGCVVAWGIEQEARAQQLLATMVRHYQFKCYLLTGVFLERSERSGITYLFRRLRPTVALAKTKDGQGTRVLAALCMHPIGHYKGSWAGAMCPTDDVIAHLSMMRGDEPMFWKRSTQHPSHLPEAAI